jgi:glycosyltransferase involved in cell wall biosynthesis
VNETIEKEAKKLGFKTAHLIYNPIGESFSNQFEFDPNSNKLVHIGFLDNRKNTSFILKAFAKTKNQHLVLDIIGNGVLLNVLINEAKELGISQKVNFKGFVDLKNEIIQCSGLIMSSKSEGFSMIISDALKCGIPVILPENLDICRFIKTNLNLGSVFSLEEVSSLTNVLDCVDFKLNDTNLITDLYIKEFGKIAYQERLNKALL